MHAWPVLIACLCIALPAAADQVLPRGFEVPEQKLALAGVPLSNALQVDDRKALDDTTATFAQALEAVKRWVADHPDQRTAAVARIVTAADKLAAAANRLRALLDQHADGALLRQGAIDGLHRWNELIEAHQGDPIRKEVALPEPLRKRTLAMLERVASEVQRNKSSCAKILDALSAHLDEDRALAGKVRAIDEARPQDQREAERVKVYPDAARWKAAIVALAPLNGCQDDARLEAVRAVLELR